MKLELSKIKIDGGTQVRAEIHQPTVQEYTEAVMNGDQFPPVVVFHDGVNYYLADGFHRYFAHKNAVVKEIEVEIHNGTQRNAKEYAMGANYKHGLKRTNEDKRNAVLMALDDLEWSLLSNREIAKLCRVSSTYVNTIKESLENPKKVKPPKEEKFVDEALVSPKTGKSKSDEAPEDYEETEDDKIQELLVHQKSLEEENHKLLDRVAVSAMDATPEEKALAEQTIAELREQVRILEIENNSLKISRDQYMKESAEKTKQINYYKNKLKKFEG